VPNGETSAPPSRSLGRVIKNSNFTDEAKLGHHLIAEAAAIAYLDKKTKSVHPMKEADHCHESQDAEITDPTRAGFHLAFSACVRRAWLCGKNPHSAASLMSIAEVDSALPGVSGLDFRPSGLPDLLLLLSNHMHLVLRTRSDWLPVDATSAVARDG